MGDFFLSFSRVLCNICRGDGHQIFIIILLLKMYFQLLQTRLLHYHITGLIIVINQLETSCCVLVFIMINRCISNWLLS